MKKAVSLLLALSMLFVLCACGGNDIETSLVLGRWESSNRVFADNFTNYTLTFYEDGSCTTTYYDIKNKETTESTLSWTLNGEKIEISKGLLGYTLTYTNENGVERLMGPQAEGYWYDHVK